MTIYIILVLIIVFLYKCGLHVLYGTLMLLFCNIRLVNAKLVLGTISHAFSQ